MPNLKSSVYILGLIAAMLITLPSCETNDIGKSRPPTYLRASISENLAYIPSDLIEVGQPVQPDTVTVALENIPKHENSHEWSFPITGDQGMADVWLSTYRVSFTRTDGGTAVPQSFTNSVTFQIKANESISRVFLVTTPEMKKLPPLDIITAGGVDPETHQHFINCNVKLEFWGKNGAGQELYANCSVPIVFADWPN